MPINAVNQKPGIMDLPPDTTDVQKHAESGPSSEHKSNEQARKHTEQAPNLLMGLDMTGVEEEADLAVTKIKRAKEQINIEGSIKVVNQMESPREALCVKYNEEFDLIAAGYADGVIRIFKTSTGEPTGELIDKDVANVKAPCTCIKHRHLSKLYPINHCYTATYANGCVKCWNYQTSTVEYTIREKRQTFGIVYHPRFPKFVTFGDDLKIHFYDEETKVQERVLLPSDIMQQHDGHMSRIFAACFHTKNNYELITGGWDDVVHFWDLRQPYALRHLSNVHICGEGLDINQRGNEILTCSFQVQDPLQIFDYASGRRICSLEPDIFPSKLYCGKYLTKNFFLSGGADNHLLRIVDLSTTGSSGIITNLSGGVYSADIGPQKKQKSKKDEGDELELRLKSDMSGLPRVAFVAGKKIFQIDFY